jgi:hypothetical protein
VVPDRSRGLIDQPGQPGHSLGGALGGPFSTRLPFIGGLTLTARKPRAPATTGALTTTQTQGEHDGGKGGGGEVATTNRRRYNRLLARPRRRRSRWRGRPLDLSQRQGMINALGKQQLPPRRRRLTQHQFNRRAARRTSASAVLKVPDYLKQQTTDALLKPRKLGPHRASIDVTQT